MEDLNKRIKGLDSLLEEKNEFWQRMKSQWQAADSFIKEIKSDDPELRSLLNKSIDRFKAVLDEGDLLKEAVQAAEDLLSPLGREMKEYRVSYVGHAHIDMNWMWPWQETVDIIYNTFRTAHVLMDEYPDLVMLQSQASTYKAAKDYAPDIYEGIKRKIEEGQWEVVASTWVEADKNMANGETQARQLLETRSFFADEFGFKPEDAQVDFEPDLFGHPLMTPQLLSKAGVKYYYHFRCGKGHRLYWWESPDGSRLLVLDHANVGYGPAAGLPLHISETFKNAKETGLKEYLLMVGIGDHGGGPTRRDLKMIKKMQTWPIFPSVGFSKLHDYLSRVEKLALEGKVKLPVVKDELNFIFRGCYTTHGDIKFANRTAENLLLTAEAFSLLGNRIADFEYPSQILRDAWRRTCFSQFHDILPGSGKRVTSEYAQAFFQETSAAAGTSRDRALNALDAKIDTRGEGIPVIVHNQLPESRTEPITAMVFDINNYFTKRVGLYDDCGNPVPVQITGGGGMWGPVPPFAQTHSYTIITFTAEDVPGLGYRTYFVRPEEDSAPVKDPIIATPEGRIETPFYKAVIDPITGSFSSLIRKSDGWEVVRKGKLLGQHKILMEAPHPMSAWDIGQITKVEELSEGRLSLVESGPLRAKYTVTHKFNHSTINTDIIFYHDTPRIDFKINADWLEWGDEQNDAPMLRTFFPVNVDEGKALYEIPFGHIEREMDSLDVPALRWGAFCEERGKKRGITLLNDCKYGYSANNEGLALTMIRSPYFPNPWPDIGKHVIGYSILLNDENWSPLYATREGMKLNLPMHPLVAGKHEGSLKSSDGFLTVTGDNVVSCIKKATNGDGIILRLYNVTGKGGESTIESKLGIGSCTETDILERPLGNETKVEGRFTISLKPYEIKTLLLR